MDEIYELINLIKSELRKPMPCRDEPLIISCLDSIALVFEVQDLDSRRDLLTGLGNDKSLARLLQDYESSKDNIGIAVMDLCNLKLINDRYGRTFGDKLIVEASKFLDQNKRINDVVLRAGVKADEFYIISKGMSEIDERSFLKRLVRDSKERKLDFNYRLGKVTIPLRFHYGYSINDGSCSLHQTKLEAEEALNERKRFNKTKISKIQST